METKAVFDLEDPDPALLSLSSLRSLKQTVLTKVEDDDEEEGEEEGEEEVAEVEEED